MNKFKIGGLYKLTHTTKRKSLNKSNLIDIHHYMVFDIKPELEDGIWIAVGMAKRLGNITSDNDVFALLEYHEANDCQYPKILTSKGIAGYLYLHNDNEILEEVKS